MQATWVACSPKTLAEEGWGGFSAVLYYFGLRLHKDLDVPIGLIESDWGGSPIEPWTIPAIRAAPMYNGMIAPLKPLAIRGVIWYQGETNAMQKNRLKYFDKMKDLIEGWRKAWGYDFPFYFVQIAPFAGYPEGELPALWEAQVASLKIPKTGMVVTTDLVDNMATSTPSNKFDVGNRLALWALAKEYGKKDLVYSGPLYQSMKIEGDKIRLSFAHARRPEVARRQAVQRVESPAPTASSCPPRPPSTATRSSSRPRQLPRRAQVQFGWRHGRIPTW